MSFFAASPFLTALGWALLNSLWQFAVCWLIYRSITGSIKNLAAPVKHSMALLLLFAGTVAFIAGLSWKFYTGAATDNNTPLLITGNTYYNIWHTADTLMDAIMPYWSALYLLCVAVLFIKFCLFVQRAGKLQKNGITKMNAVWRTYVISISAQLGIKKEVQAMLSVHIDTPQVIGFLKPVILLPAACLNNLTTDQLEAVLLHELVHIKRHDYLINLFVTSVEILFFFNPFVKQIAAAIRKEREYSCDDMVIQFQYHPHNYASALLMLEKSRMLPVTYGIAASGKNGQQLLTRIERIMGIPTKQNGIYKLGACLLALLLLGFIATINPAKVAVDNFGAGSLALALTDDNMTGADYNKETSPAINNTKTPVYAAQKNSQIIKDGATPDAEKNLHPLYNQLAQLAALDEEENNADNDDDNSLQTVAHKETIDFSLPQKDAPVVPEVQEKIMEEPYVPASSFSFQVIQDTALPKTKGQTYNEHMATDALLKAQKAIAQINWLQIEKQLKYSKRDIAKLKKELTVQIQNLNWQKINNEVKAEGGAEQLEKLQEAARKEHAIKVYQQTEAYNEALQLRLAEQEQLLKESSHRTQQSQGVTNQQQKKLQLELKKRRIIYI